MPRIPTCVLLCALSLAGTAARADVYKYTDTQGNIQYTDKPLTLPAQRLNVETHRTDNAQTAQRSAAEMKSMTAGDKSRQTAQTASTEQKQAADMTAQDKADSCVKSRERYTSLMNSLKLYKPGENGEREYLNDKEIDQARASAKQVMDELCAP